MRGEKREPIKPSYNPFSALQDEVETTSQEPPSPSTLCQQWEPKIYHTDNTRYLFDVSVSQTPDSSLPPPCLPTTSPAKDNVKISSAKTKKPTTSPAKDNVKISSAKAKKPKTKAHPTSQTKNQTQTDPSKDDFRGGCCTCTVTIAFALIMILLIWIIASMVGS